MKSNMFSHHHTHTGVKQTSTGIQSGMGSREFPQRMIRYPSKVTFYVFSLSRSRMDSISEIWFYRLRFCFGWQVRCCVLCVSGEKCPSVSQTVETRALKADKEVKDKKKQTALTDWHPCFLPAWLLAFTVLAVSGCAVYCALGLCTAVICLVNRDTTAG